MVCKIIFLQDYTERGQDNYASQEEAAFSLGDAIALVAKGVAVFSDPADLEANRVAVDKAKLWKPATWVHPMVPVNPRRWG